VLLEKGGRRVGATSSPPLPVPERGLHALARGLRFSPKGETSPLPLSPPPAGRELGKTPKGKVPSPSEKPLKRRKIPSPRPKSSTKREKSLRQGKNPSSMRENASSKGKIFARPPQNGKNPEAASISDQSHPDQRKTSPKEKPLSEKNLPHPQIQHRPRSWSYLNDKRRSLGVAPPPLPPPPPPDNLDSHHGGYTFTGF
jgi:hypothetical protein